MSPISTSRFAFPTAIRISDIKSAINAMKPTARRALKKNIIGDSSLSFATVLGGRAVHTRCCITGEERVDVRALVDTDTLNAVTL